MRGGSDIPTNRKPAIQSRQVPHRLRGTLMPVITEGILPLNFEPVLGDTYKTAKSGEVGVVTATAKNSTGSVRVQIITETLTLRWTTWTPKDEVKA